MSNIKAPDLTSYERMGLIYKGTNPVCGRSTLMT